MKKIKNASKVIDDALIAGMMRREIDWKSLKSIDANSRGRYGYTPLMVAARDGKGNEHHVRDVLQIEGADANATDEDGFGALILACQSQSSSVEIVRMLVEAGADLNVESMYGHIALQFAFHYNSERQEYLLGVITERLRANQMETLLLGEISSELSERAIEDFYGALRQTTALRHLRLSIPSHAPQALKENHSILRVSAIRSEEYTPEWVHCVVRRNRRAFVRCQRAVRCVKNGLKARLGKDVANLISEFVLRTAGEKIWACVE